LCTPVFAAEGSTDPLHIRYDTALWSIVVFVGLLIILRAKAWGPILEGLKKREPEARGVSYQSVAKLAIKPYPDHQAVANAYRLCCMKAPEAHEISPLAMWDLHFLRQLDHSGFIDRLYG